ncbi:3-hydroxyacyl-CoA dehydrogenase NAD-binding domain-containing protein [Lentilitoribacter sp. EG35]|uniref:3-hydroxyacyl-CoA dehydrogenase NAD-binding domain-containing protein n=1 Tax=Lentilitoribacter sp. EG35 TaxID=3234192 RepID=UPI003460743A
MRAQLVTVDMVDEIAIVRVDNPPVNATSTAMRIGLLDAVHEVEQLGALAAILICKGRTFIAGGDMSEFDAPPVEPHLPDVVQAIEDSSVPFIAAMHGNVLGGGLEIAMGCAWRIALEGTKFGMPEVNVGLIPGAGGTQRLPRLVGTKLALDMCANGTMIKAEEFYSAGGVDLIVAANLEIEAIVFAKKSKCRPSKICTRTALQCSAEDLKLARIQIEKKARGRQAPLLNFEAVQWSAEPFNVGQPKERSLHLELRQSDESKALRHAFFAERSVAKPSVIHGAHPLEIKKVVVVGGGLMGSGIATSLLNAGKIVTLIERDESACEQAIQRVEQNLTAAEKRGLITSEQKLARLKLFTTTLDYRDSNGHDLAIEAVFEDVAVKRKVFNSLGKFMDEDAILATNTSYLDPQNIFEGIANPERCVGLHFFSPAHIMKLLEVIYLPQTSAQTVSTAFALAKTLRKTAVLSGICDGFIGNRILAAYRREAEFLLADGALPEEVDQAMRDFGMAMGPFEAQDMSGLQIAWANRKLQTQTRNPNMRYVTIADHLCEIERFGQRSGKGWYDYPSGPKSKVASEDVTNIIEDYSTANNITRRNYSNDEIADRLLAIIANEGALIVEEGIAENAAAVDVVKLYGYGFPRWRGGPMHFALQHKRKAFSQILKQSAAESGETYLIAAAFRD